MTALFRHPHLVRGTVHTPYGAFTVVRGHVEMPEDIGEALGWLRLETRAALDPLTRSEPPMTTPVGRVALDAY
jgi:hypothetical protein